MFCIQDNSGDPYVSGDRNFHFLMFVRRSAATSGAPEKSTLHYGYRYYYYMTTWQNGKMNV
jgi:hypothetical protein